MSGFFLLYSEHSEYSSESKIPHTMHISRKNRIIALLALSFLIPAITFAHQPRIPVGNETIVLDPEISKAYYTELRGIPQTYTITSDTPFALYVNLLAPDRA